MFREASLAKTCCCGSTFLASVVLAGLAVVSVRLRDVEDLATMSCPMPVTAAGPSAGAFAQYRIPADRLTASFLFPK